MVALSGRGWRLAPSLVALVEQSDLRAPDRSTISDGSIGDPAHAARVSDHNPAADGYAHAYDITHDPIMGVDCHMLAPLLLADVRTKYVIWNNQIGYPTTGWKPYTGVNPHTKHLHVSIRLDATHVTAQWPLIAPAQEAEMNDAERKLLNDTATAVKEIKALVAETNARTQRFGIDFGKIKRAMTRAFGFDVDQA